jgi:hypothetical protein
MSELAPRRERRPGLDRAGATTAAASLGLQFVLELTALGALAYWGFSAGTGPALWLLGLGAPAVAIAFWALLGAPRAPFHAYGAGRVGVEVVFFGAGVLALAAAGRSWLATGFGLLVVANIALLRLLGHDG